MTYAENKRMIVLLAYVRKKGCEGMPRPCKKRRICAKPQNTGLIPVPMRDEAQPVILAMDEFETIRLIDLEGLNQEECAKSMDIARTTAQAIYNSARKKLAVCLVEGRSLKIEGGNVILCDHPARGCHGHCPHRCAKMKVHCPHEGGI
ncbi:Predicted DNA-binding protein, UPF0251 family [Eubacterium aggregans]|uniref:Predicted DNA-binding protein, UPF0251 family n=3 Tax=Eubacterium aggregans TaxID=81409 RepID=A0A1H4B8C4_9FIRM|nr:Predicted DNA-binding protein, UPF0251 family [Eubacterium aggregans]